MPDVVVTVPRSFGLDRWIDEGDPAGVPWSGAEWDFYLAGMRPNIKPGERVYVIYNGALRGYAPLVRIADDPFTRWQYSLVRHGGAVAVTIPEFIQGFRGWRYRWWERAVEVPFPAWQDPNACIGFTRPLFSKPAKPAKSAKPAAAMDGAHVGGASGSASGSASGAAETAVAMSLWAMDEPTLLAAPVADLHGEAPLAIREPDLPSRSPHAVSATRVVHCRRDEFDLYIGRPMARYPELKATGFGNPFRPALGVDAIARYREWLLTQPQLLARLPELRGKRLGCWCAPKGGLPGDLYGHTCHGEVLAALADGAVLPREEASK